MVNMDFMCLYENYSDMVSFCAPTLWMKESKDPVYIKNFSADHTDSERVLSSGAVSRHLHLFHDSSDFCDPFQKQRL